MSDLSVLERLAAMWDLALVRQLSGASCSTVWVCADPHGEEVVLKLPEPHAEERLAGPALLAFSGRGGVTVLRHDPDTGAILMPLLRPGITLNKSDMTDSEMLSVTARLTLALRSADQLPGIPIETMYKEFLRRDWGVSRIPIEILEEAYRVFGVLRETTVERRLVHGDLHHGNILRHGDDWIVIDPKGVIVDPAFEPCAFLRNPVPDLVGFPDLEGLEAARIEQFAAELGDPIERIWGWGFVQTAVAAWWSDGEFADHWVRVTMALRTLGPRYGKGLL